MSGLKLDSRHLPCCYDEVVKDYVMKSLTSPLSFSLFGFLAPLYRTLSSLSRHTSTHTCPSMELQHTHEHNTKCKHWQLGHSGLSNVRQRREKGLCNVLSLDEGFRQRPWASGSFSKKDMNLDTNSKISVENSVCTNILLFHFKWDILSFRDLTF